LAVKRHQGAQQTTHNNCWKKYSKLSENVCVTTLIHHYREKNYSKKEKENNE